MSTASDAVDKIIADLTDRSGIKHEWERIDIEIQQEIRASWILIVSAAFEPKPPPLTAAEQIALPPEQWSHASLLAAYLDARKDVKAWAKEAQQQRRENLHRIAEATERIAASLSRYR